MTGTGRRGCAPWLGSWLSSLRRRSCLRAWPQGATRWWSGVSTTSQKKSSPATLTSSTASLALRALGLTDQAWRIGAARAHVLGWASYVDPTYQRPRHLKFLVQKLMAVERGEIKRLIVMMPPRHGKSETTTVKFPSWYLGRHPWERVIIASHTATLAARFSLRARNDFSAFAPEVFGVQVDPDVSAMYRWGALVA